MTSFPCAARALALSLTLAASGALWVVGPTPASAGAVSPVGNTVAIPARSGAAVPVGGAQLAASGVIVNLTPGVPAPPAMPGRSYLLADMDTGQILVAKAPHEPHMPASTMKTLTALTLIPILGPSTKITVTRADVGVDGTHLGIVAGRTYTSAMLMQGMLMASGNDSAYALARGNQSVAVTLRDMNTTAALLGAADTVARDPSGLDAAGQQSSAYDLALIARAGLKLPDFRQYVGTKVATLPGGTVGGKAKPSFKIANHNKLLFNYPGLIGVKNGYTIAARFSYVEAATRGGKTYLLTEMDSAQGSWHPAAALLDWAFAHAAAVTPIGQLVEPTDPTASIEPAAVQPAAPQPATPAPTALAPTAAAGTALPASAAASAREPESGSGLPVLFGALGGIAALALVGGTAARRFSGKRS